MQIGTLFYGYRNFTSSSNGYSYDANGNLANDAKKGTTLTYNAMNKPTIIVQNNTFDRVVFEYDAAGVRVSKTVIISGNSSKEYYIGGLVVQTNNTVKHFAMAEGRVRNNSGTLVYEYFITDQQGNTRVSFEDNGSGIAVVRQENSYYPFGMPMAGNYMPSDANKKLYNAGSEWQDEFGGIIDYYSTFFREYDPVIGRFNSVDPKADATVELSIYHYSGNNPVNFNDPMGDETASGNFANFWNNLINYFFSDSYKGPSFNYNFETNTYEEISKGRAEIMLRELGGFVTRFNELEKEVVELTKANKHDEAYGLILNFLRTIFGPPKNYYLTKSSDNSFTHITNNAYKPPNVVLSKDFLNLLIPDRKAALIKEIEEKIGPGTGTGILMTFTDFGSVVRSVYHEIYVHVPDYQSLSDDGFKFKRGRNDVQRLQNRAELEFRAYYGEWTAQGMPENNVVKFLYWARVVFGDDPLSGAYSAMSSKQQARYANQYNEMLTFVLSFFNMFRAK